MSATRWCLLAAGWMGWSVAMAEEAASRQVGKIVTSGDIMQWLLALLAVLAVFLVLVWLLRKSGSLSLLNKGQLAIVAGLSLGMREKLVLVRVGDKQVLLGVTAGRIDKLLELEGEQRLFQTPAEKDDAGSFAQKLMQIMQSKADV